MQEKDEDAEDDGSVLSSLLDEMRPYVLRRVKAHVSKNQSLQKKKLWSPSRWPRSKKGTTERLMKNVLMLAGTGRPVDGPSLMNLADGAAQVL